MSPYCSTFDVLLNKLNQMKYTFIPAILLMSAVIVMQSCASSVSLDARWSNPDLDVIQPKKILVIVVGQNMRSRQIAEDAFEASLQLHGFNTVGALDVLPVASGTLDSAALIRIVRDIGVDAVVTARAVDISTEQYWVPGTTYPVYYGSYGGYYGRYGGYGGYYGGYGSQGYMSSTTTALLETNLFNTKNGQLAWIGQSSVVISGKIEKLIEKYATVVVNGMISDGVLAN